MPRTSSATCSRRSGLPTPGSGQQVFDNDHALTFAGLQLADYSHHIEIFDNELGFVWRGIALNTTGGHDITIDEDLLHDIADTGIFVADQTLGPNIRIRYNVLNRVGEDAIRVASGANGVTVERNQAWRGTAPNAKHGFWFESKRTPVTSLVVTNNCFFGYDGGTTNHGAVFIDNEHEDGSVGGSGVRIESNRVESSAGKRTIWVGPNASPNVSGWLRYNQYYPSTAIAPSSLPSGMQVYSNSVASFPPGVCTVL
jgi:Right handed beta helix region